MKPSYERHCLSLPEKGCLLLWRELLRVDNLKSGLTDGAESGPGGVVAAGVYIAEYHPLQRYISGGMCVKQGGCVNYCNATSLHQKNFRKMRRQKCAKLRKKVRRPQNLRRTAQKRNEKSQEKKPCIRCGPE